MQLTQMSTQVYIFTHDSVGVGEDGPTHQPVETVAGLRVMPNMDGAARVPRYRVRPLIYRQLFARLTRRKLREHS